MRLWCELISRRLMFRTNGVKFGVKFFVATMVLSSAGLLYTAAQGRAQDNASGEVKDHGGRKIKTSVKTDYPQIARPMRVTGNVQQEALYRIWFHSGNPGVAVHGQLYHEPARAQCQKYGGILASDHTNHRKDTLPGNGERP